MIPEAGRTARGTNIVNILPLEQGEQVTAMMLLREFREDEYLTVSYTHLSDERSPAR